MTTLAELAQLLGGELRAGAPETTISGVGSLAEAGEGEIAFFANPKYLAALRRSRASAVLVPREFPATIPLACAVVAVDHPSGAFAQLVERFTPPPVPVVPGVAPTAVLGRGVRLGADVSVGPYAVIEDDVRLGDRVVVGAHGFIGTGTTVGDDTRLWPHVTVRERCRLGRRIILHPGVVIGGDGFGFETREGRHVKIPQTGVVQIDDDVGDRREQHGGPRAVRAHAHRRGHEDRQPRADRAQRGHRARTASCARRRESRAAPAWGST